MDMDKKVGIIIQARMGSSRLPGKVMIKIGSKTILDYQIDRLKTIKHPIFIATTTKPADDEIEQFARQNNLGFYRGDEDNVLKRYYECAVKYQLDVVVRITSDCPLIDAELINRGIESYLNLNNSHVYLSNTINRTYPRGFDFEVFSFDELKYSYENATDASDKEHVTPYLWKNKSGRIQFHQIEQKENFEKFRLTLDTVEDLQLIKILIEEHGADQLDGNAITQLLVNNPQLVKINQHIEQKKA